MKTNDLITALQQANFDDDAQILISVSGAEIPFAITSIKSEDGMTTLKSDINHLDLTHYILLWLQNFVLLKMEAEEVEKIKKKKEDVKNWTEKFKDN